MTDKTSIEQRIANYLDANNITIIPESRGSKETLCYMQHRPTGAVVEIGVTVYEPLTGVTDAVPASEMARRLQVKGFVTEVTKLMAILLKQTNGRFYEDDIFDPIHDACDRVEARYSW